MSKVILTQKQARMFENHKYAVEELLEKRVCDNCPTSIDSLPIDDVVKAIAYGYEVEPEFKSFEEAMEALREGYAVKLHHEKYKGEFVFNINTKTGFNVSLTFDEFYNGKWTIER